MGLLIFQGILFVILYRLGITNYVPLPCSMQCHGPDGRSQPAEPNLWLLALSMANNEIMFNQTPRVLKCKPYLGRATKPDLRMIKPTLLNTRNYHLIPLSLTYIFTLRTNQ